jgi:hypothetical protein
MNTEQHSPTDMLQTTIDLFIIQITEKNLNFELVTVNDVPFQLATDWSIY